MDDIIYMFFLESYTIHVRGYDMRHDIIIILYSSYTNTRKQKHGSFEIYSMIHAELDQWDA